MVDSEIKGFYYQGIKYPLFENIEDILIKLPSMQIYDDDVLLLAYPKSGTHWIWEITNMILNENNAYMKKNKAVGFLESNEQNDLAALKTPRVLSSHLQLKLLPREILTKNIKTIFIARNPKDIVVSYYWHVYLMDKLIGFNGSFSRFFQYFLDGDMLFGNWFDYMLEYQKNFAENPNWPVHKIIYEDIQKDPVKEIQKIATFLGKQLQPDLCMEIATKCSFNELKKNKPTPNIPMRIPGATLFRKGVIGDWKNYFTVAENEMFDKVYKERAKDLEFQFQYES